jgi:hypothetical protein
VPSLLPPLTDNPIDHPDLDAFGFRPYIERLDALVAAAQRLPLTIGVFGPWGTGKSSFLTMWEQYMKSRDPAARTLRFNPWKYDQKVDVWAALIQSLLAELKQNQALAETTTQLARHIAWLMLRGGLSKAGNLATGGIFSQETFQQALDAIAEKDAAYCKFINTFESTFEQAVSSYVGKDGRLVVFVDDLDRCTPEASLAVLEALKLFIGDARCVFVIAMDFDAVVAVAESRFSQDALLTGNAYLEKIIQIPFFLPTVSFDTLKASLLPQVGDLARSDEFWELIQIGLGANPRRVRRYINVLNLAMVTHGLTGSSSEELHHTLQLAELLIIRSEHREFFRYLTTHPDAWRRLEQAVEPLKDVGGETTADLAKVGPDLEGFAANPALVRLLATKPGAFLRGHPAAPDGFSTARMLSTVQAAAGPLRTGL